MITATETDTNLPEILKESKLRNLVTREKYHIYGLRREENPAVLIEYEEEYVNSDFKSRVTALSYFLELNGIGVECFTNSDSRGVDVGLRIDLRQHLNKNGKPLLAASILKTVIYCLEDRIDVENMKKYKLSSIPTFPA